ncbi:TetR/AcrR family transcriptional regulator [Nakamurella silvestris]|nr:TetR/AcrR family transcriptional regulator [Nakamurella silvestris]
MPVTTYGGSGDPTRTIRLLWSGPGAAPPSRRGPKAVLSLPDILDTAVTIADTTGRVSLRAVADRLDCTAMALYTHVANRAELLDLMYDRVHLEIDSPVGASWQERVNHWSAQVLQLYVRHGWIGEVSLVRPVLGPGEQQTLEYLLEALATSGIPSGSQITVVAALFGAARQGARMIREARQAPAVTATDDLRWWQERMAALAEFAPDFDQRFPYFTRLTRSSVATPAAGVRPSGTPLMETAARDQFDRTVDLLLAGATQGVSPAVPAGPGAAAADTGPGSPRTVS